MTLDPLSQPVAFSMRSTEMLHPEDSLDRACSLLRNSAYPFVPVVDADRLVAAVSEQSIAETLATGVPLTEPATLAETKVPLIHPQATGADALRRMSAEGLLALLVVDEFGRVAGVVAPSDLVAQPNRVPHPPTIGGMATPFGVYLTTGSVHGGASGFALVASGALLFLLFLASDQLALYLASRYSLGAYTGYLSAAIFLLSLRSVPLSGTHAAEHMVVHAIERGEPLVPEVVRRMPRVHPRCGTNLAVAGSLYLGLNNIPWTEDQSLRMIAALLVTYLLFRPLGALVQFVVTTKPPSDRQIESGIRAAKELLDRYARTRGPVASPWQRIMNSGMLHVAAGSTGVYLLILLLIRLFNLPLQI